MSEKDKMLKGLPFEAWDKELSSDRRKAKKLCKMLNNTETFEKKKRNEIFSILFQTDKHPIIEPNFFCDYGYNIEFGDNFYSNHNLVILDGAKVKIGNNVMFGPNVGLYTAVHPINYEERNTGIEMAKEIHIGNNVWLGGGVTICPGVTIGDNCVIGAGSVVVKNISENSAAAGNPCKVIKKINN